MGNIMVTVAMERGKAEITLGYNNRVENIMVTHSTFTQHFQNGTAKKREVWVLALLFFSSIDPVCMYV